MSEGHRSQLKMHLIIETSTKFSMPQNKLLNYNTKYKISKFMLRECWNNKQRGRCDKSLMQKSTSTSIRHFHRLSIITSFQRVWYAKGRVTTVDKSEKPLIFGEIKVKRNSDSSCWLFLSLLWCDENSNFLLQSSIYPQNNLGLIIKKTEITTKK